MKWWIGPRWTSRSADSSRTLSPRPTSGVLEAECQIAAPETVFLFMWSPNQRRRYGLALLGLIPMTLGAIDRANQVEAAASEVDEAAEASSPELRISISAGPPRALSQAMRSWTCRQGPELARLRKARTALAESIRREEARTWTTRCRRLREQLAALEGSLERPPDRLTWFHLARGLEWVRQATRSCSRSSLFSLSYGLSQARSKLLRVDARLEWLDAQRCEEGSFAEMDDRE